MLDPLLDKRVAVVTGANSPIGIGAATARALAAQGASVFLHYWRLRDFGPAEGEPATPELYLAQAGKAADEVVASIRDRGGRVEAWEADLADPANVGSLFDRAERAFGPVDVLINNASHWEPDTLLPSELEAQGRPLALWPPPPAPVSVETHDLHFAVNSRAVALLLNEYARRYFERGARWGRIVSLTTRGSPGFPREVSYGASKSALESYTRAFALELAPYGVTANILNPGPTQTGWISPELEATIVPGVPMRRVARPEEIADLIVLLCSDQARLLTGQRLHALGY
jgi:3-oxoacyl-[acyl-carrier protein] reductase